MAQPTAPVAPSATAARRRGRRALAPRYDGGHHAHDPRAPRGSRAVDARALRRLRRRVARPRPPEDESEYRTAFQKDRDRVIHTSAFRRLEYKTQVFVNYEGDYYRTRLTHTLEVVQVARAIARALGLNEDLSETVALAHDLGHPPFGHAGERTLDRLAAGIGGFDHNRQSLRIVTELERRYPGFEGLNLTWETLEGIMKHETEYDVADPAWEPDAAAEPRGAGGQRRRRAGVQRPRPRRRPALGAPAPARSRGARSSAA
jgi:dGTP triphosphohydrolase